MKIELEVEEKPVEFLAVARLPDPGDNVAVAISTIPEGTSVRLQNGEVAHISHTVLEGHRFAVKRIEKDEGLYSWNMQFGTALKVIYPGEYLMNERGLAALKIVDPAFDWPKQANFDDRIVAYVLDENSFMPYPPMEKVPNYESIVFHGYKRDQNRGVGTRNYVVVFSASSLCNGIVKRATEMCSEEYMKNKQENVDGIVCCVHTEGSTEGVLQNKDKILRTLCGFLIHPNVGYGIVVYNKDDQIEKESMEEYMKQQNIDIRSLPTRWIELEETTDLSKLTTMIHGGLQNALNWHRSECPLSSLCLALQCGGSDAFSGVTANPLQGAVAEHVIRRGGNAILAETDELIGADAYILDKVDSIETAKAFMKTQARYEATANLHGVSAQANPSGGNFYRGLYNIAIKSLGAAMKKTATTRLEGVLEYSERIPKGKQGYFFMDTPGNDIESVTGQVAGGCNIIMFSTGNGSITNFPFVPISFVTSIYIRILNSHTIKLLTTSHRYHRLENDLDINAGEYLDGTPLEMLRDKTYDYVIRIAEGERTFGERAHHSQIQIWRNWYIADDQDKKRYLLPFHGPSQPFMIHTSKPQSPLLYSALRIPNTLLYTEKKVDMPEYRLVPQAGLVLLPTSLCSGQIAGILEKCCKEMELGDFHNPYCSGIPDASSLSKFSFIQSLIHTEGCAEGYGSDPYDGIDNYNRVTIGHLVHPHCYSAFLVEHGCEKTLLSFFRIHLATDYHVNMDCFGEGSVQREGGILKTLNHALHWVVEKAQILPEPQVVPNTPIKGLIFGVFSNRVTHSESSIQMFILLITHLLENEAIVVIPENDQLLQSSTFVRAFSGSEGALHCTILNAQRVSNTSSGLHIMRMNSPNDYVETLTSLAATGASLLFVYSDCPVYLPGHPFVPTLRLGSCQCKKMEVLDALMENEEEVEQLMIQVLSREERTKVVTIP